MLLITVAFVVEAHVRNERSPHALTGIVRDANESIARTNAALGLEPRLI